MGKIIKLSICVVTYNQKRYLRECLDSLVTQEVNFDYEIIVGDDASTDGSSELIMEYCERYPDLIVPVLHEKNIGPTKNYISVHSRARGDYVAHMDGDDVAYSEKLKKQVDFLDLNDHCVLVWHKVNVFNDEGEISRVLHNRLNDVVDVGAITQIDVLKYGMLGAHSSTMYRRSAAPNFKSIKEEVLDYFMIVLIADSGSICRLEEILGGYRVNKKKITASKNKSLYFNRSPIRVVYCRHLNYFYLKYKYKNKKYKEAIFLNAFFNFFVDVRFLRSSAWSFLALAIQTISFSGAIGVYEYFPKALNIRSSL